MFTPRYSTTPPRGSLRLAAVVTSLLLAVTGLTALNQSANAAPPSHPQPHITIGPRPSHAAPVTSGGPLYYHGGLVLHAPRVYLLFWGWTSDPYGEGPYVQNFLSHVGCSSWLRTVSQYGGSGGTAGYCITYEGAWSDSSIPPPTPTDAQIQNEAHAFANYLGISSADPNAIIIVALPTGHSPSGFGSSFCAYHGVVSGTSLPYIVLPYIPDAGYACGAGSVTGSPLDGVSIVLGHELAEVITDPQLNAWYDVNGYEIADKCAWIGLTNTYLNGSYFPTQPLWSNAANACVQGS